MKTKAITAATLSAITLLIAAGSLAGCASTTGTTVDSGTTPAVSATMPSSATPSAIEQALSFIIEEEKLAYDVYTVLGEKWDLRTMQNIVNSEATHQSRVENLLVAYDVTDPRSSEIGVFTNPDLQKLYDDLIAQGSASAAEAIQVGILIEETDIADIDDMLTAGLPTDIVTVLEALKSGSINHLAAFERQV